VSILGGLGEEEPDFDQTKWEQPVKGRQFAAAGSALLLYRRHFQDASPFPRSFIN